MTDKDKSKVKMTADDEAYFRALRLGIPYYDKAQQKTNPKNPASVKERVDKSSLAPCELKAQKLTNLETVKLEERDRSLSDN